MPQILMPYTVHLDHTLRVTPLNTLFAKGDSAAHRFELTIMRAGVQEELTGCKVVCKFYRMAESAVVSVDGTIEDGKAVAVLNKACYDYIGRFALTIAIQNGEEETTVFYGDGYMHGQRADTSISGEYIIYDINTLLEKIAEIDAATQAANTATSNANTATANANTATGKANTAANTANTAATNANAAKDAANAAAGKINNMTVSAMPVSTGTATAALSTVDGHYHLALGLPKGDTGATPQISVQVQTGAAGSEAQVSVSGTAENPVIHLTIPRGDVGNIGVLTINGKAPDGSSAVTLTAADVGALATGGTAVNASKLGGKAPEYYIQPRNLLDNSDFRNPVNQRGNSSYSGEYGVDRWRTWNSDTLNVSSGYITVNGRAFEYILPSVVKSTAHTLVAKKTDGSILLYTKNPKDNYTEADNGLGLGLDSNVVVSLPSGDYEWIALYEGSYTAETLPPYVPKGYAAELAECQRYYHVYTRYYTCGFVSGSAKSYYMTLNINSPMRCMPSVTLESYIARKHDGYSARTGSSGVAPENLSLYESSAYESGHIVIIDTITKAVDTNNINFSMQLNNLVLIADL